VAAAAPRLVVLGDSPVTEAVLRMAPPLGFEITRTLGDESADSWVIVAALSSAHDHPAARAALERGVPYVAMVASRERAAAFVVELRAAGLSEGLLARLRAPAGLDLGAATSAEVALSILAEVVQQRRARSPGHYAPRG
jgi:xanthine dehydrogenase accessory factor